MIPRRSSDVLSCWLHLSAGYADAGNFWEKTSLGSCFVSASWVAVVGRGLMSARFFESLLNKKCPSPKMCPNCRQYWLPSTVLGWMIFLRAPAIGSSPCHCVAPPLPLLPENWKGWRKIEIVQAIGNFWILSPVAVGNGRVVGIRFNCDYLWFRRGQWRDCDDFFRRCSEQLRWMFFFGVLFLSGLCSSVDCSM